MSERDNKQSEARDLVERVEAGVERGNVSSAAAAFTRSWRDAVPELPLRFSVILVRVDRRAVAQLIARMRRNKGRPPQLKLDHIDEKTVRVVTARGKRLILGELPHADVKLLVELGKDARLYRPQLLEIRHDEEGKLRYLAVELVRPELQVCPVCGKKHSGSHLRCNNCRRKRRRAETTPFEHTPVPLQEAIDRIAIEGSGELDDGDLGL